MGLHRWREVEDAATCIGLAVGARPDASAAAPTSGRSEAPAQLCSEGLR